MSELLFDDEEPLPLDAEAPLDEELELESHKTFLDARRRLEQKLEERRLLKELDDEFVE